MSSELDGKIGLVTGASCGIGAGIAIALSRAGADMAVNFVSREAEAFPVLRLE
jgi:NAD(P)-dependent dehydrogenase (short-subunit alcohol dehydrogenase family)